MSKLAEKIFNLLVWIVDKRTKYEYVIPVDYEGYKILTRPFIFSDIVMVSGVWEPYNKAILNNEIKNTDIIVDVGAYIGIYAIPLAKKVNKVIAFEPHPLTSKILEKSVELNQIHNITIVKKLVGNSKEKIRFRLSKLPMVSSAVATNHVESVVEIESVDLDTFLSKESRIDWLLIDVEGYEAKVLDGAKNILLKHSPKIIVELYPFNFDEVQGILTKIGYMINHTNGLYYYAVRN